MPARVGGSHLLDDHAPRREHATTLDEAHEVDARAQRSARVDAHLMRARAERADAAAEDAPARDIEHLELRGRGVGKREPDVKRVRGRVWVRVRALER
jgi:hypothetical protein